MGGNWDRESGKARYFSRPGDFGQKGGRGNREGRLTRKTQRDDCGEVRGLSSAARNGANSGENPAVA